MVSLVRHKQDSGIIIFVDSGIIIRTAANAPTTVRTRFFGIAQRVIFGVRAVSYPSEVKLPLPHGPVDLAVASQPECLRACETCCMLCRVVTPSECVRFRKLCRWIR